MLTVCTWLWGKKFGPEYVQNLEAGVHRHLKQPHRFVVVSHHPEDANLTARPGCFARLRMFDRSWQVKNGIDDRLVCIDLDAVITGPLDPLFDRPEPFVIMRGGNSANPCPYGGALMMLRLGANPEIWDDFSLPAAAKVPHYAFPDDQSWIYAKNPNAAVWNVGAESGVYCFKKPGWPNGTELPPDARIVMFRGNNLPSKYLHLDWVKTNWST